MLLSICIPSYNRLDCLDNCLNSILIASKNVDNFDFEICISDNFSEKNQSQIDYKYQKFLNIKFNSNKKNLGFALNAIQTLKLSTGKFAWLIGNDDLILPNTLNYFKNLYESNKDVDYFFVNSYHLNSKYLENFSHPFNTYELKNLKLKPLSKFKENKKVNFWRLWTQSNLGVFSEYIYVFLIVKCGSMALTVLIRKILKILEFGLLSIIHV